MDQTYLQLNTDAILKELTDNKQLIKMTEGKEDGDGGQEVDAAYEAIETALSTLMNVVGLGEEPSWCLCCAVLAASRRGLMLPAGRHSSSRGR